MKLALFGRRIEDKNLKSLTLLINKLQARGDVEFCYCLSFYDFLKECVEKLPRGTFFISHEDLPTDIDLFLSLGGDGTFLESLTLVRNRNIPVAGINFGRLGFLTTACIGSENPWIEKLFTEDYIIEERAVLNVKTENLPDSFYPYALNEVTIQRSSPVMLEIEIAIDKNPLPRYWADGILIATATGSTAYSLSIGGPVVTPDSRVLIIAPIAPHNLNIRPLIVPETATIQMSVTSRQENALLTVDNRSFCIENGQKINISKGNFTLKSVSINNNFIAALNQKLLWGEDKRNGH